ncbi:YdcF family protein [Phyllobacterium phragmitis]|uniref:YdcF family protein n=1 Tax=Phyllobacterium phragmitis TaxID=2670329 RepID=A0A2S9IM63_9HYPH|nr:YdcF family protein [Phyllobacterium phragmitis]PRD41618.1 YdcF family protein [Phyllobacterium phragmitis]
MSTANARHASAPGDIDSRRPILLRGAILCAMLAICPLAAIFWADPQLTIRGETGKADVIVVLGGDGPARAVHASELWLEGTAPIVLVSGDGDCLSIRRDMIRNGVSPSAILVECLSGSTWQNALYSAPFLERLNVRNAVVVTNWFHSRRAVESFANTCPRINWMSSVVEPPETFLETVFGPYGIAILKEYPKLLWYRLRFFSADRVPEADATAPSCLDVEQRT